MKDNIETSRYKRWQVTIFLTQCHTFYDHIQLNILQTKTDNIERKNKIFSAKNLNFLVDLCSKWWRIYASVVITT